MIPPLERISRAVPPMAVLLLITNVPRLVLLSPRLVK